MDLRLHSIIDLQRYGMIDLQRRGIIDLHLHEEEPNGHAQ